jgi:putative peptide zinc metalloprotease protein
MTETKTQELPPLAPRLAEGIDLIGEYSGSGFKETPYLARRADGQVLQLTRLLYLIAEGADGWRNFAQIAEEVSARFGRHVSADNIRYLVEKKLRPLGVLAAADGSSPSLERPEPMLALNFRTALVPEGVVRAVTAIFWPLFLPPVVIAVLGGLVAVDVWLFSVHGIARSAREILYEPVLFLMVFGLVLLSTVFHECGHATACRYGGARPGVMGVGIYLVWPAFYCDVTDAYRLSKAGRLRTDLGGIYFNAIFSLLIAGAYACSRFEPLLILILIQQIEILHQLPPFLRLDGYYILSDLTGVPDLFTRITPILKSLIPWREPDPRVSELRGRVRVVVTVWVLLVVPLLAYLLVMLTFSLPRLLATAWDSLLIQCGKVSSAFQAGRMAAAAVGGIRCVTLVLPVAGLFLTFGRIGKRAMKSAWRWLEGRSALRVGSAIVVAAIATGYFAFVLWPDGGYERVQRVEQGFSGVDIAHAPVRAKARAHEASAPRVQSDGPAAPREAKPASAIPSAAPETAPIRPATAAARPVPAPVVSAQPRAARPAPMEARPIATATTIPDGSTARSVAPARDRETPAGTRVRVAAIREAASADSRAALAPLQARNVIPAISKAVSRTVRSTAHDYRRAHIEYPGTPASTGPVLSSTGWGRYQIPGSIPVTMTSYRK